jgi:hypothetical protein
MSSTEKFESFNWIRGVLDDKRISIIHRAILIRLVVHRQKDGRCNPGRDQVTKELGVDRKTVTKAVDAGVLNGWLAPPIRGRRANANFIFTFPDQEVPSEGTSRVDQEVPSEGTSRVDQEVPSEGTSRPIKKDRFRKLRRTVFRVKKDRAKMASEAESEASKRHGHLTGKENGQQQPRARDEQEAVGDKEGVWTRARLDHLERVCREAAGLENDPSPWVDNLAPIIALLNTGYDLDTDVLPTLRAIAKRGGNEVNSWAYYAKAAAGNKAARSRGNGASGSTGAEPPAKARPEGEERWRIMWDYWVRNPSGWPIVWGPDPTSSYGCEIPKHLIEKWAAEAKAAKDTR